MTQSDERESDDGKLPWAPLCERYSPHVCMTVRGKPFELSPREELMHQRGVSVDNATVNRSVGQYSPQSKEAFHRRKHLVWVRWQVWSSCRCCGKVNQKRG
jgi:transposase-like protein